MGTRTGGLITRRVIRDVWTSVRRPGRTIGKTLLYHEAALDGSDHEVMTLSYALTMSKAMSGSMISKTFIATISDLKLFS